MSEGLGKIEVRYDSDGLIDVPVAIHAANTAAQEEAPADPAEQELIEIPKELRTMPLPVSTPAEQVGVAAQAYDASQENLAAGRGPFDSSSSSE